MSDYEMVVKIEIQKTGLDHKVGHLVVRFFKSKNKNFYSIFYNGHKFVPRIVAQLMTNPKNLKMKAFSQKWPLTGN